jgi:catechol 2,3-dioxygenase-like lactoylglutathione lyase family enzyme
MAVVGVAVVSVPVSDQERAKDFYIDVLGLELVREDDSVPGIRWVQVAPPEASTALTLVTWFDSMPAGSLRGLVLRTDDLHGDYERLIAAGTHFDGPPQLRPWGVEETVCYDPDGNGLVLQQG